jgi:hypothetical protein
MSRIETLETEIENLELQRAVIFQKMAPLQTEAARLYSEIDKRRNEMDDLKLLELKAEGKLDWGFLLTAMPESSARYKAKSKAFAEAGLNGMGYFPETNQYNVTIALYHDRNPENDARNDKQLASVIEILPFLKPHEADGAKWIDIMEESLSAHDHYYLKAFPDGKFTVGGRWRQESFPTLEVAWEYIRAQVYYERERDEDDDE